MLDADGWVQGNSSRAVLPLARHHCSIHCENSRVAHGTSKRKWAPQTIRDTPKPSSLRKSSIKETELIELGLVKCNSSSDFSLIPIFKFF